MNRSLFQTDPEPRSGFSGALARLFAGPQDPNLTAQQNAEADKQAMLQAGLMGLMASRSGPGMPAPGLMQILAQGAMAGQQAGQQARQGMSIHAAVEDPSLPLSEHQRAVLRSLPPSMAAQALTQMMSAGGGKPQVVAPGSALVTPGGREVYRNPKAAGGEELPSDLEAILWSMGMDPSKMTPEQRSEALDRYEEFRRDTASQVNVDTGDREARGVTDIALKNYEEMVNQSIEAENRLNSLAVMEAMLDEGMDTSRLAELTQPMRSLAASFGIADAEALGQQELFRAISNRIALEMKGNMTGQMSDRDIIFLQNQAPRMGNTVQGNRMMIEVLKRFARRKIEVADEMDRYFEDNGSLMGWRRHLRSWLEENPLSFSDLRRPAPWEG